MGYFVIGAISRHIEKDMDGTTARFIKSIMLFFGGLMAAPLAAAAAGLVIAALYKLGEALGLMWLVSISQIVLLIVVPFVFFAVVVALCTTGWRMVEDEHMVPEGLCLCAGAGVPFILLMVALILEFGLF